MMMRRWRKIERAAGIVTVVGCSTIRGEICLYYERMTSRREDGGRDASFSRLVLMRVYCRSGRLRCGRFWMAFQQRSKVGLKGQGVSRVTPSRGWGPTLPHTWRAQKAWILRATSSAFQYSAPMPPCRQRSPNRSHLIPSDSRPCLSALRSRQRRQILFQFCRRNLWFSRHPRRCPSR